MDESRLDALDAIAERLFQAWHEDRCLFIFGNGGSAALASHMACDLGKGTATEGLPRLRVLSLTDNVPLISAWANDTSYAAVFSEQLAGMAKPGDVVFAISGSGNSPNVVAALDWARQNRCLTLGLSGFQGGKMVALCDISWVVPSDNMQIIEDLHVSASHALFTTLRRRIQSTRLTARAATAGHS